ncbi:MAG: DUF1501 domain-containing protein [Pirellulales bacterium]|nr:DUF1501 domain-containing protein [Pirellulales bacterium]
MTSFASTDAPLSRRAALRAATAAFAAGGGWLTPVADRLARAAETDPQRQPAQSIILLWLAGGPSQLETFDPHPGRRIAGETRAIDTAARGVQLAGDYPLLAEQMESLSVVRSMVSQEGDHERGTYLAQTGYRPDAATVHPSIGAICCHELPLAGAEIPRHISILPGAWPSRGGFLGPGYDPFTLGDPRQPVPDLLSQLRGERATRRVADLEVVDRAFARGRARQVDETLHRDLRARARTMMSSEQIKAFDVGDETAELRRRYGETPFGRGCLAARRLIEVGVRCVEVTLGGWDTHVDNHELHRGLAATLDPAFAALVGDLRERGLWSRTVVLCAGEFGRTPTINALAGRDHWPRGFSAVLGGGGLRGGQVVGSTDPEGKAAPSDPQRFPDMHATVLSALGIDPRRELISSAGRPLKLSEGTPIARLLSA